MAPRQRVPRTLWRGTGTLFACRWPYWLLSAVRYWGQDLLIVAPAVAAAAWWASGPGALMLSQPAGAPSSLWQPGPVGGWVPYYPALLALLLCMFLMYMGRRVRDPRRLGHAVAVSLPLDPNVTVVFTVLAGIDLLFIPGGLAARYAPVAFVVGWLVLVRGVLLRIGQWWREPTEAGLRPAPRVLLSRSDRMAILRCKALRIGTPAAIDRAQVVFGEAARHFADRGDRRSQAWCMAALVDSCLRVTALDAAEKACDSALADKEICAEPAVLAAFGLFSQAVGRSDQAREKFREAFRACRRRVPRKLRLLAEPQAAELREPARVRLVWLRQYTVVLRDLLRRAGEAEREDPELAMRLVLRVASLAAFLSARWTFAGFTSADAADMIMFHAMARERCGAMLAARGRHSESVPQFLRAARLYEQLRYRRGAGAAYARASIAALANRTGEANHESMAVAFLFYGLISMERERGRLRAEDNRLAVMAADEELHVAALAALAGNIRFVHDEAAELALWLLESLHRTGLADAIRQGLHPDDDLRSLLEQHEELERRGHGSVTGPPRSEAGGGSGQQNGQAAAAGEDLTVLRAQIAQRYSAQFAQALVPSPTDVQAILSELGARLAVYYHSQDTQNGWSITIVTVLPSGIHLGQQLVGRAVRPAGEEASPLTTACGLLDAVAHDDPDRIGMVHQNIALNERAWTDLGAALIPAELDAVLSGGSPQDPEILVIVPDGPVSSVPFAGLRLRDGSALIEHAAPVFMPSLAMSLGLTRTPGSGPGSSSPVIVTHLGPSRLDGELKAARAKTPRDPVIEIADTNDRDGLRAALAAQPRPFMAVISQHGTAATDPASRSIQLNDGSALSMATAATIKWPDTVILGSCWGTHLTVTTHDSAFAMPTACLLGGATTVIGAQAPLANDSDSAAILAQVILGTARGAHPATALRQAAAARRAMRPANLWPPPTRWANLTAWTVRPPLPPAHPVSQRRGSNTRMSSGEHADAESGVLARAIRPDQLLGNPSSGSPPRPPLKRAENLAVTALLPLYVLWRGLLKAGRFALGIAALGILAVTAILHGLTAAPSSEAMLAADAARLPASVTVASGSLPATLIGELSSFRAGGTGHSQATAPAPLDGQYVFLVAPPGRYNASLQATLHYQGKPYPATLTCGGQYARVFCVAVVHLPPMPALTGFPWSPQDAREADTSAPVRDALVIAQTRGRLTSVQAQFTAIVSDVTGTPQAEFLIRSSSAILPYSPVVLPGASSSLPVLGFAIYGSAGQWVQILPAGIVYSDATRLAGATRGS